MLAKLADLALRPAFATTLQLALVLVLAAAAFNGVRAEPERAPLDAAAPPALAE